MSSTNGGQADYVAIAGIGDRIDGLREKFRDTRDSELSSIFQHLIARRQGGDESTELLVNFAAVCSEAVRRSIGDWPSGSVVRAAVGAALGIAMPLRGWRERAIALAMVGLWHGVASGGVHVVTLDDSRARKTADLVTPIATLLGVGLAIISRSATAEERRRAYAAAITVGSYVELATDYLRDHLYDSRAQNAQRGLCVAIVEDVDAVLIELAMGRILLSSPARQQGTDRTEYIELARRMQRGADYQVSRKHGAVTFAPATMPTLKRAVGWEGNASIAAIASAQVVERALLRNEQLIQAGQSEVVSEITVQGFVRLYHSTTGFSTRDSSNAALLREIYGLNSMEAPWSAWPTRLLKRSTRRPDRLYLETEGIVDRHRAAIYKLRSSIRDEGHPGGSISESVHRMVLGWSLDGVVANEFSDTAKPGRTPAIPLEQLSAQIQQAVEHAHGRLGVDAIPNVIKGERLAIIDRQWRDHQARLKFLQRHAVALYRSSSDVLADFEDDAKSLLGAMHQCLRDESIQYLLKLSEISGPPADGT